MRRERGLTEKEPVDRSALAQERRRPVEPATEKIESAAVQAAAWLARDTRFAWVANRRFEEDGVTRPHHGHGVADTLDDARASRAGHEGQGQRQDRGARIDIGARHAAGDEAHQDLVGARFIEIQALDDERRAMRADNGRFDFQDVALRRIITRAYKRCGSRSCPR